MKAKRITWPAALALALLFSPQSAAQPGPADWPCAQVYRPHLSVGEIWPLTAEEAAIDWQADREAARLAAALALGREEEDAEKQKAAEANERRQVDEFADAADGDRKRMIALLLGVVAELDARRFRRMEAVRTFARRQQTLADNIIDDQSAFDSGGDRELGLRAEWGARVYQEREASLKFLCEKPVELESRAFRIGRMVAAHLDEAAADRAEDEAKAPPPADAKSDSWADEYPTDVKADYVFACMAVHGQTRETLRRCACSMDAVAESLPFADYVAAETVMMMRRVNSGADKISMFRGSPWARNMIAKLKRAQVDADFRCFGR